MMSIIPLVLNKVRTSKQPIIKTPGRRILITVTIDQPKKANGKGATYRKAHKNGPYFSADKLTDVSTDWDGHDG